MYLQKFKEVSTLIFDVDGVLTDGSILVTEAGEMLRTMNIKDGFALQHAVSKGLNIVVISGGTSEGVRIRLNKLGVTEVHLGVKNKESALKEVQSKLGVASSKCLAMGDDVPDASMFGLVACITCPADAVSEIRERADYISPFKGGKGCVRDVIEKVMRLQNLWE